MVAAQDSIKAQFSRTTICSLVSWCDQCVNMVNTVGHYQYPCVWCQRSNQGRCTTAYMDDCDGTLVENINSCPSVGLPQWAFVLTAFSGVIFILSFHCLYWSSRWLKKMAIRYKERAADRRSDSGSMDGLFRKRITTRPLIPLPSTREETSGFSPLHPLDEPTIILHSDPSPDSSNTLDSVGFD